MSTRYKFFLGGLVLIAAALFTLNALKAQLGEKAFKRAVTKSIGTDLISELEDGLHVYLCGSGTPMSDTSRHGPCTAVIAGKRLFIVDVGSASGRNLGPAGIVPGNAEAVFLTHFHADHFNGLGDFLLQRWASSGANEPLPVYGPAGVETVINALNTAYSLDQQYRIKHHGDVMPAGGFGGRPVTFEIGPDGRTILLDEPDLTITAFQVEHGGIAAAVGYRVDYKGRSVVISGDTSRSANLEANATGADLLVHEAVNEEMLDVMSAAFRANDDMRRVQILADIKGIHTTPLLAAESAAVADVDMLVLSHILPPVPSRFLNRYYMRGIGKAFDGEIVMGQDGMLFSLPAGSENIKRRDLL